MKCHIVRLSTGDIRHLLADRTVEARIEVECEDCSSGQDINLLLVPPKPEAPKDENI